MGIIYKKCLKCGSLDTIDILYGHPTANAMKKAEEGKIKLGGGLKTDGDPQYLCNECGHEWDRQTAVDQAYADIKGMKAEI
ncbi:hypothetical protein [Lacticigenium naphthae]|uniref:hypothetical protein n=1 Tax=Lacticigenium naphthae TaxID=515351 RepID=UPI0003FF3A4F|nr:hypothetical protein [Lacticigenium naphthae]